MRKLLVRVDFESTTIFPSQTFLLIEWLFQLITNSEIDCWVHEMGNCGVDVTVGEFDFKLIPTELGLVVINEQTAEIKMFKEPINIGELK
jgi:hypothetical protein